MTDFMEHVTRTQNEMQQKFSLHEGQLQEIHRSAKGEMAERMSELGKQLEEHLHNHGKKISNEVWEQSVSARLQQPDRHQEWRMNTDYLITQITEQTKNQADALQKYLYNRINNNGNSQR